ncbi:hypothetical protein XF35_39890 [Streptomyces platensis subsp. clarensis]|uniref:Uncharacterized protein n=1 Tax=Streptomyces showdoensis TaxID=68268 RepID=A0A2P2GMJ1_STREW|nr:hypothetical protein [Streptomyces showdoensis]KKZ72069.1 hypothetical protein VO63_19995 [Streptomyces showdoensis]MCW7991209.1 hypothetical protein [Streptomyces platensis subsp. clarensis]
MIEKRAVTNAVLALLAETTGLPVGRGRLPAGAGLRYYVLYSLDTAVSGPPLADEHDDLSVVYQVTSVSAPDPAKPGSAGSAEQAEWLADKARTAFLARNPATGHWLHDLPVPGAVVMTRELDTEPGGTNDPADAIMSYVQRFRFTLTPA